MHHCNLRGCKPATYLQSSTIQCTQAFSLYGIIFEVHDQLTRVFPQEEQENVKCDNCMASLGVLDSGFEGVRLYKWSVLVRRANDAEWQQNLVQNFVCAQLLELIESQNVRHFVAFCGKPREATQGLLVSLFVLTPHDALSDKFVTKLWVFNPDLKYSASHVSNGRPRRAMKIYYKNLGNAVEVMKTKQSVIEELSLPQSVLQQLEQDLKSSHAILPEPARKVQDWCVGLLDRFDPVQ